jgi:hypothetical protein
MPVTYTAMQMIDNSVTANRVYRLQSELDTLKSESGENKTRSQRIEHINKILSDIEKNNLHKYADENELIQHKLTMKDAVYKVKWHTLTPAHKLNRLDEYLDRVLVVDIKIKSKLRDMIKDKSLKTKDIDYRIDMGKIISIKILSTDNGKFVLPAESKTRKEVTDKKSATIEKIESDKASTSKSNVGKSNVGKSNVGKSNLSKSNVGKSNVGKSNVGKSIASKLKVTKAK